MTSIATDTRAATGSSLIALLYAARALRGFGDGFAVIILPAYMVIPDVSAPESAGTVTA